MTIGRPAARGGMLVVLVAAALVTAGCTGAPAEPVPTPTFIDLEAVDVAGSERNGIQYLEGPQALGVVLDAMRSAAPVRMTGSYARSADDEVGVTAGSVAVDYVGTSSASRIELIVDGRAVSIVVVGPDAAIGENGAWTCVPAGGSQLRAFAPFTSPTELVEAFFGDGSGAAVSAPTGDPLRLELLLGAACAGRAGW